MEFPADTPRNNKDFREILRLLYAHCIMLAGRKFETFFGGFAQQQRVCQTPPDVSQTLCFILLY